MLIKILKKIVKEHRKAKLLKKFKGAKLDHIIIGPEHNKNFKIAHPEKLEIGYKSVINGDCYINACGGVKIGHHCHIGKGLTIYSHNHNWRSAEFIPYDKQNILKPVAIGDCVWIGCNVTIAPSAEIEDGAIISTGSVVFGKIPRCSIARGNPAIVIGKRDELVFNKLYGG